MPNRKTAKIPIRNLKCFGIIAREIAEEYPEYENYLIDEGVLHIKEYVPPTINDIDKVLEKLKFNYATKKYKYETYRDKEWKIQCKLPPKTKRFCPLVLK
jgi:hypothetical protein